MNGIDAFYGEDPFADIIEEYAEEASFLWERRHHAVKQADYTRQSLFKLDTRIEKYLAGLRLDYDNNWPFCTEALMRFGGGGETFVATIMAVDSNDTEKLDAVLAHVGQAHQADAFKGLVSALAWLPSTRVRPLIKNFLFSDDLDIKHIAIAACRLTGDNPGDELHRLLSQDRCRDHTALYSEALRLAGDIKRHDIAQHIYAISCEWASQPYPTDAPTTQDDSAHESSLVAYHASAFWAHWSACLLGHDEAHERMKPYALFPNPYQERAIELMLRCLPHEHAYPWIGALIQSKTQNRHVIQSCRVLGDPAAIPTLIEHMSDPMLARFAADAFATMTGVDLVQQGLAAQAPEQWHDIEQALEDDEMHEAVTLDLNTAQAYAERDSALPWPNLEKIQHYWQAHQAGWTSRQRYRYGQLHTTQWSHHLVQMGNQAQRRAAALDLAVSNPHQPLINTAARVVSL